MNLKEALQRIEALERRVKELEARPEQHIHYHTHPAPYPANPLFTQPYVAPFQPFIPHWNQPICGAGNIGGGSSN